MGRVKTYEAIVKGTNIPAPGVPESFKVLIKELQSLALDIKRAGCATRNEIIIRELDDDDLDGDPTNPRTSTRKAKKRKRRPPPRREPTAEAADEDDVIWTSVMDDDLDDFDMDLGDDLAGRGSGR